MKTYTTTTCEYSREQSENDSYIPTDVQCAVANIIYPITDDEFYEDVENFLTTYFYVDNNEIFHYQKAVLVYKCPDYLKMMNSSVT